MIFLTINVIDKQTHQTQQNSEGYVQIWTKPKDKREGRTKIKKNSWWDVSHWLIGLTLKKTVDVPLFSPIS